MIWQDKGYLLKLNNYNENSSIAEFYTLYHGKKSGIIFGSSSKKNKSYLILGNKMHLNYSSKNENTIGNFKIEIDKVNTAYFFDHRVKLNCITYTLDLIRSLTAENLINKTIFDLLDIFFNNLFLDNWVDKFVLWELELFKSLGYEINYMEYVKKKMVNNEYIYVLKNNERRTVPNFLVENFSEKIKKQDIINGLKINGDFLDKTVIQINNEKILTLREEFIKLII